MKCQQNLVNVEEKATAECSMKAFALCFTTHHPREAMNAFLEKRQPRF